MFLKYNISNAKHETRAINVTPQNITIEKTKTFIKFKFNTDIPHLLQIGDYIVFSRRILTANTYTEAKNKIKDTQEILIKVLNNETVIVKNIKQQDKEVIYPAGYYTLSYNNVLTLIEDDDDLMTILKHYTTLRNKPLKVTSEDFSENNFIIDFSRYYSISVKEVYNKTLYNADEENTQIANCLNRLPFVKETGEKFTIEKFNYAYKYKGPATNEDYIHINVTTINPDGATEFITDHIIYNDDVYVWDYDIEYIECEYINAFLFKFPYGALSAGNIYYIEDNRFFDANGTLYDDIEFYEEDINCVIALPLANNHNIGLNNSDILQNYFNNKKKELIPQIVDYEKRCFVPCIKTNNSLSVAKQIHFNLFVRDRSQNDNWTTNDTLGWNQCKTDDDGNFIIPNEVTNGDLLGHLNFTDDDILYQKKKVSKSFLRLSFFDSDNPIKQRLLFYSTIFLDTSELYEKYIRSIDKKIEDPNHQLTLDKNLEEENLLTASFVVRDKFDRNKTSEGFYLYLFPENIEDKKEKTIYMKVEFNHAGYGYTIPFIYPNNEVKPLSFNDKDFPFSLMNEEDGNLSEFYRQLYIPITITYDKMINDYVYYFNICKHEDENIIINLYEPKINPLV